MVMRRGTFSDLPADLSYALFSFPISSSVIIDANGKIEGIKNTIGDGTLIARTADSTKRHTLAKINGFDSAYSADTNSNGILLTDTSKLPIGDAERHMTWVVVSQDGVVGGYRGGGRQYWVDNPYPDYRLRTDAGDFTGSGNTNNSQLHGLSLNHRKVSGATSRTQMTVDGSLRLDQPLTLNTSLGTYGIKGAETAYYTMKGNTVLHYIGKRAATTDEQYKIDSVCQFYTGMALPSGHPYATTPWMVDDGATVTVTGSSASTLANIAAVSAAVLALAGAASLALAGVGSTSTTSAPIAAQAQAPLGAIVSAGAGGVSATGLGTASLQSIASAGTGVLPIRGASASALGDVASSTTGGLAVSGAASTTLGPVDTVSAGRADVRAAAPTSLGSIVGSATAGGQPLATASSASVLGSIATAATGSVPVVGAGSIALATIASNSGAASAVRGAGAASLGAVVSLSATSMPIGAIASTNLSGVRADGRSGALASAIASSTLGGIVGAASATVGQDTDNQLVGRGWTLFAAPRRFVAAAIRRSFIVSSTGCKRMLNFPPKYAHEVRNAVVDFAPALSDGERLIGQPTVAVMKGDLEVSAARIEGAAVHFTLSGGTAAAKIVQCVEVHCPTDGDQVLEEVVSVTMLS